MFCHLKTSSKLYRWFVLFAACLTMFLRALFIFGTLPVFSNYYNSRFDDRQLSSMIGSIQISVGYLAALPTLWLVGKIGVGWVQIIGGLLPCVGMIGTAFSTQAWQALIFNGIITGLGSACLMASCFTIMPMYFTNKDKVAPFVTMTVFMGIGTLLTAKTISFMTKTMCFQYCLCASGIILLLNVLTGVFYQAPDSQTNNDNQDMPQQVKDKPKLTTRRSIIIKSSSQGSFDLTNDKLTTAVSATVNNNQDDVKVEKPAEKIAEDELGSKLAESETNIGKNSTSGDQELGASRLQRIKSFIRKNKFVRYQNTPLLALTSTLGWSGYAAYTSNIADYAANNLEISQDDYDLGVTIQGVGMLLSGLTFTFLAQTFTLSSLAVHTLGNLGQAAVVFSLFFQPSLTTFYIVMFVNGVSFSLVVNAGYPRLVDMVGLRFASLLYMVEGQLAGCFIMPTSILAAYLQVEVNPNAGLYLALGLLLCSVLFELPATISTMIAPKIYASHKDEVHLTQFTPYR